jgi:prepilin-type N-terminal cleavage/methylation domain-containing protein
MRRAFTLIELLVVIAIIAILSVVVVLTLSPGEMLKQTRDQNRLSDMDTLTHALSLSQTDASPPSLGTSNTVYVSLPDTSSTCGSWGLPVLPSGYSYHCAPLTTLRKTDGTGWIPVNLSSLSLGSPLGSFPIDPTNASSSRLYYTYTTNGSQYEVTAVMESAKYGLGGTNDVISNDGGTLASVYEKGSKLGLEPLDYGDTSLVGLWTFDEGTGTVAYDRSGVGNNFTFSAPVGYINGRVGPYALNIPNNNSAYLSSAASSLSSQITVAGWVNIPSAGNYINYFAEDWPSNGGWIFYTDISGKLFFGLYQGGQYLASGCSASFSTSTWHYAEGVYNGNTISAYLDGGLCGTSTFSNDILNNSNIPYMSTTGGSFSIDDLRLYSRALSAAQIAAMYAGGK